MKKIFVIGDSISCYYGKYLEPMLAECFEYDRKGGTNILEVPDDCTDGVNGGPSSMVLTYLKTVITQDWFCPDLLLFNCGLHDIKKDAITGEHQINPDDYQANLKKICELIISKPITPIWIRTTPVNRNTPPVPPDVKTVRDNADVVKYNTISDQVMEEYKIRKIDLYTFTENLPEPRYLNGTDNVHYNEETSALQAAFIAGAICTI